jgi:TRAP-type mannitol/chloroaromatic compound transport system permease small subunit
VNAVAAYVRFADRCNDVIGRAVAWLTLGTVVVCFVVVVLRYAFSIGFIWLQELYVWQHGAVFMLGAGYALLHGSHVRVDIVYARLGARRRAWIDLIGTAVFLLPWLAIVLWYGLPFVGLSWRLLEPSAQMGGLPGYFLLKSVIVLFAVLVGAQGLASAARSVLAIRGAAAPPGAERD